VAARKLDLVLTRILGGLHDEDGHITLPGFYDGVKDLPPDILTQWKKLNLTPDSFLKPIAASRRREGLAVDRAGLCRDRPAISTASSGIPVRAPRR
jgi:hypothetical protein